MDTWILFCAFCAVQKLEGHLSQREEFTWGLRREVLRFLCHSQSKAKRSDTTKLPPENKLSRRKNPLQKKKKKSYIQLMLVALSCVSQEAPLCVWSRESSSNLVSVLRGGAVHVAVAAAGCSIPCTPMCTAGRPSKMGLCIPLLAFQAGAAALVLKTGSREPGY